MAVGSSKLNNVEELIDEARNGRMFILVDDEDRENEGDLVIPAQMATPQSINFMAQHGRGLICLALERARVEYLGLSLMSPSNGTRHGTAFTTSIEARHGVTTGISAADRARTISVAINGSHGSEDIVSPGHIFPLVARDGGVLVRAGHTEAAVDLARLAGLNPSGVICEIMRDDGTMARLDDLLAFAERHQLKIGAIRDLISYRRRHDRIIDKHAETSFFSRWGGEWKAMSFYNRATGTETMAFQKGDVSPEKPTLVRMHTLLPFADTFGEECERAGMLGRSMELIAEAGAGVVVILNHPSPHFMTRMMEARNLTPDAQLPELSDLRDYGAGAQVLAELGVHDMILLTSSHQTPVGLAGYDLSIVDQREVLPNANAAA